MNKFILVVLLFTIFTSGCQRIGESLSNKKKANNYEFLVKKKNPLVMPPQFSDLPKPAAEEEIIESKEKELDLSKVLKTNKNKKKVSKNSSLEKSISEALNKN